MFHSQGKETFQENHPPVLPPSHYTDQSRFTGDCVLNTLFERYRPSIQNIPPPEYIDLGNHWRIAATGNSTCFALILTIQSISEPIAVIGGWFRVEQRSELFTRFVCRNRSGTRSIPRSPWVCRSDPCPDHGIWSSDRQVQGETALADAILK
jgi:hypothetical protein